MCDAPATDLHHIVNKNRVGGNQDARELSNVDVLVVPLCSIHHIGADTDQIRRRLLEYNAAIYGRKAVVDALIRIIAVMKNPRPIQDILVLVTEQENEND